MAKYIDIEQIRAEIERRIKSYSITNEKEQWIVNTYWSVLSFLDTLQEEKPSKDLDEAAEEYRRESYKKAVLPNIDGPITEYGGNIKDAFKEGAQLQKEQMLKDAVECEVFDFSSSLEGRPRISIPLDNNKYQHGDKVKIIIVKEDDEK